MSSFWDLCRGGSSVFSRAAFATGEWEEAGLPRASTPVSWRAAGQASPLPAPPHSRAEAGIAGPFLALAPTSVCGC